MEESHVLEAVGKLAARFAAERTERQQRRSLDKTDFDALRQTGYGLLAVPTEFGGHWQDMRSAVRPICDALRMLAAGDSSVALVSAMHPAVLSYWLLSLPEADASPGWKQQFEDIFRGVIDGDWWGTITSEPGSGGDVNQTRTAAELADAPLEYRITGQKHFGSGSGVMTYMVTTAVAQGEDQPDWFFLNLGDEPWDGSRGVKLIAPWDGHGMTATQSHAMQFEKYPATRIAWQGHLPTIAARAGGFIGCLFTSVIVGIVDAAVQAAYERVTGKDLRAFEQTEWARARMEAWQVKQLYEGMLRAVEQQPDPRLEVLYGKTSVAELSESLLTRLCRLLGGGTYARHSPFGHWFEDVRALGFLRPPWGLAYQGLIDGLPAVDL